MFLKIVVFCACVAVASAAFAINLPNQKPEKFKNVEGCYVSELDVVIPYGISVPSKKDCWEYHCGRDKLEIFACAVAMYDLRDRPNCYIFEDHKTPFPGCCPKIKCPEQPDSSKI